MRLCFFVDACLCFIIDAYVPLSLLTYFPSFLSYLHNNEADERMKGNEKAQPTLTEQLEQYEKRHQHMRKLVLPQEARHRLTQWCGGYRWFESENVICLEKVRRVTQ